MSTIRDLAKALGLSTSTVSRALTDSAGVSEDTRRLVKETAERMNYSVNRHAQHLVTHRSNTIGFMIPDISDAFFSKSAYGIEETIRDTRYTLVYSNAKRRPEKIYEFLCRAEEYCYDGAFVTIDEWTEPLKAKLRSMSIPVISLRRKTPDDLADKIPFVDSDNTNAPNAAINHLLSLGHKHFGYIGFSTPVGSERQNAFVKAAERRNIELCIVTNQAFHNSSIRISIGYNSARQLLEKQGNITAICAGDDQLAIGVLQYLNDMHLRVPEDISVIGYDDRDVADLFCIQLTTIRQQLFEIGECAGKMMLDMIEHPRQPFLSISVPTTLQIRKTTGPVNEMR